MISKIEFKEYFLDSLSASDISTMRINVELTFFDYIYKQEDSYITDSDISLLESTIKELWNRAACQPIKFGKENIRKLAELTDYFDENYLNRAAKTSSIPKGSYTYTKTIIDHVDVGSAQVLSEWLNSNYTPNMGHLENTTYDGISFVRIEPATANTH